MSVGPIPFTAVIEYARLFLVEDFNEFLYLIRSMDDELMRLESSKARPSTKKPAGGNKNGRKSSKGN